MTPYALCCRVALAALLLPGCSNAQGAPQPVRSLQVERGRTASVNVAALLAAHPLHPTLNRIDEEIAALRATESRDAGSGESSEIARGTAAMNERVAQSSNRIDGQVARLASEYAAKENGALATLLTRSRAASVSTVRAEMARQYRSDYDRMRGGAQADSSRYRREVLRTENDQLATYAQSIQSRTEQAYRARAVELSEKESAFRLELERQDAGKRLQLTLRLQNLFLDASDGRRLHAQLRTLDRGEASRVAAMQALDRAELARYAAQIRAKAETDYAEIVADVRNRTLANLRTHDRVARLESGAMSPLPIETGTPSRGPAISEELAALQRAAVRPADIAAAMADARRSLADRFGTLATRARTSRSEVDRQIAALTAERRTLRAEMAAQVMREAQLVAQQRGISVAYPSAIAPRGSVDLTAAVRSDLTQLVGVR